MKNVKGYHGFLGLPRHSKLLLQDLGYDLFGFYIGLVMEAIWFRGNSNFGCIAKTQKELAIALDCSQSTISRALDELQLRKYLLRHRTYIRLSYFPLFLADVDLKMHSRDYASLHDLYADMYIINAELQQKYADSQDRCAQNAKQRLYNSSKGNLSLSEEEVEY